MPESLIVDTCMNDFNNFSGVYSLIFPYSFSAGEKWSNVLMDMKVWIVFDQSTRHCTPDVKIVKTPCLQKIFDLTG